MNVPDAKDLLAALLFTPGLVTRFPATKPQPVIRVVCSCGAVPRIGDGTNLNLVACIHKLYSSAEVSGHVWVGRCEKCGHWFYGAQLDRGVLAKHSVKIITKQK